MKKYWFINIFLLICFCSVGESATSEKLSNNGSGTEEVRNFMNETIAIIKEFVRTTSNFSANISLRQKVAGVNKFVNQDCRAEYQAPGYLEMNYKGMYPYTVVVSNFEVITTIAGEKDVRPLKIDEEIFENFLGIGYFKNIKMYNMRFRTEGDLYVLKGKMPVKFWAPLQRDIVANSHTTVFMEIWVDPVSGKVVKSHVKSLGGRDATYTYREQWINKK